MPSLILVRHGQTVWHEGPRYAGSSDVGLTDLGRAPTFYDCRVEVALDAPPAADAS